MEQNMLLSVTNVKTECKIRTLIRTEHYRAENILPIPGMITIRKPDFCKRFCL